MEEFVSSDLVGTALCFGFLAGAFFIAFIFVLLRQAEKKSFKSYYLECGNDQKRKDLSNALDELIVKSNDIVNYSNINYFKKLHNSLVELRNYLLRRSLN